MTTAPQGPQVLKSVSLALRVMEELSAAPSDVGVSELSRRLGVSKATVYRLLTTLESQGFARQNPDTARYGLGAALRRIAHASVLEFDLAADARSFLDELRDVSGHTVHLAVLEGTEAVYVARAASGNPIQVASAVGDRCPAHCVSTGKVLLAYADTTVVESLASNGLEPYTDLSPTSLDDLERDLERVRDEGFWINWGEWRREVRGAAAPVWGPTGTVLAAIGVCGPAAMLTDETLESLPAAVMDAAQRLSTHLGYAGD